MRVASASCCPISRYSFVRRRWSKASNSGCNVPPSTKLFSAAKIRIVNIAMQSWGRLPVLAWGSLESRARRTQSDQAHSSNEFWRRRGFVKLASFYAFKNRVYFIKMLALAGIVWFSRHTGASLLIHNPCLFGLRQVSVIEASSLPAHGLCG
jgi:hypothetical protein